MIELKETDAAVVSLDEYRHFIKALEWLNEQADVKEEAEWLMLLIRRQHDALALNPSPKS